MYIDIAVLLLLGYCYLNTVVAVAELHTIVTAVELLLWLLLSYFVYIN